MIKLGNSWIRYQKEVLKMFAYYSSLSEEQLNFHSQNSKWNLSQVLIHIYHVEYLTFGALKERVDSGIKKKSTFKHQKRYYRLAFALFLPSKYKVPKAVIQAEKPEVIGNLKEQWQTHNQVFSDYIKALPDSDRKILLFKHPIAGPFNIKQTLGFLYYHLKHHQKQLNTIKNDPEFPSV